MGAKGSSFRWKLNDVLHVTHIQNALSILAAGKIEPQLVYDESVLKRRRIQVVWLSPNDWNDGFRYGHIAFRYDWRELVDDRRYYWVEAMTGYNPTACRFLITDVDRDQNRDLQPYDPNRDNGPWRFDADKDQHYWNGSLTLEFMFEGQLTLRRGVTTEFVRHHPRMCSSGSVCSDQRMQPHEAGAEFVAGAVSRELDVGRLNMTEKARSGKTRGTHDLLWAVDHLFDDVLTQKCRGRVESDDREATVAARAYLMARANRNNAEAAAAARLFVSNDDLTSALETLLREAFDVDRVRL